MIQYSGFWNFLSIEVSEVEFNLILYKLTPRYIAFPSPYMTLKHHVFFHIHYVKMLLLICASGMPHPDKLSHALII